MGDRGGIEREEGTGGEAGEERRLVEEGDSLAYSSGKSASGAAFVCKMAQRCLKAHRTSAGRISYSGIILLNPDAY